MRATFCSPEELLTHYFMQVIIDCGNLQEHSSQNQNSCIYLSVICLSDVCQERDLAFLQINIDQ